MLRYRGIASEDVGKPIHTLTSKGGKFSQLRYATRGIQLHQSRQILIPPGSIVGVMGSKVIPA